MDHKEAAEYALDRLIKAGADKAAARAGKGRKDEFNVEANKFTLLRTLFNDEISLKAIKGGKKGVAAVNKLDRDSIDRAVADCISLADSAKPDEAEGIAEKTENKKFDMRMGGADMAALFSRTKEFLAETRDEYPTIVLEGMTADFNGNESAYFNSNGAEYHAASEFYGINSMFSAKDGEKSSSFNGYYSRLNSLRNPFMENGLQRALLEESVKSVDARMVDGKFVGKVIVTPACEDMIWDTLIDCFLSDYPMIQNTSRWKDMLGETVADKKLTFRAAPLSPFVVAGERFTSDGFPSEDMDFIKDGVLKNFALSLYGANKTKRPRARNTAFGNIEVLPGDTGLDEMIKGIGKGILLNRFSGASPGPSGDVSGVAKNSFMIENGKVTDALKETMVSFNILDILKDIAAISSERAINGTSVLPWVCFDGVTVSGK